MPSGSGPTSPTNSICNDRKHSMDSHDSNKNGSGLLTRTISYDPTEYVQKARVTKAAPPKPAYNPMQFVQLKPCNLFKSAQEQLKKSEEVKKVKEVKKEEAEDWQCNLDNWKSSRRKRVEHIIDRVVEVKKLELEEHDRNRRKSKTFSEMMEERGSRRKLSLAIYNEDDSNDLSDLGIGTSSASGKSSLSEDFDNHSVISDNQDTEKLLELDSLTSNGKTLENDHHSENGEENNNNRDYVSSPGYDTSSSTAPASSPDPSEYTYEGAIQDYKTRVSRAGQPFNGNFSKDSTPERQGDTNYYISSMKKHSLPSTKFDDRYMEIIKNGNNNNNNEKDSISAIKKDLPKVDILKRRELFEKEQSPVSAENSSANRVSNEFTNSKSIKERLTSLEQTKVSENVDTDKVKKLSADITLSATIKDRLTNLEKERETSPSEKVNKVEVKLSSVTLKDRLSSLQSAVENSAVTKEDEKISIELPNDQENGFENEKEEESIEVKESRDSILLQTNLDKQPVGLDGNEIDNMDTDREDSGIHTTDVSCSVSQADEQNEEQQIEEELTNVDDARGNINEQEVGEEEKQNCDKEEAEYLNLGDAQVSVHDNVCPSEPEENENENEQDVSILDDALEMAFQIIDNEKQTNCSTKTLQSIIENGELGEPIYENIDEFEEEDELMQKVQDEPYYQVPKSHEPYYEVPKPKPIPLYENVDIFFAGGSSNKFPLVEVNTTAAEVQFSISNQSILQPPKEKPPPPPIEDTTDEEEGNEEEEEEEIVEQPKDNFKRINSTKRIKKEIRNKRSSFLGIEGGNDDESFLELSVAPPPDMAALLQEEKRLEKQLYLKAGFYANSDTGESRDSGVSENHSRQSSEPFTASSSSEETDDFIKKKEMEIIQVLETEERRRSHDNGEFLSGTHREVNRPLDEESRMKCLEDQIRQQENYHKRQHYQDDSFEDEQSEEVLRVERELLQLEQEELKRQRENLLYRENLARRELDHGAKMLMSANRRSLQDINGSIGHYANVPNPYENYQMQSEHRQSMPDLQNMQDLPPQNRIPPPIPPAKPLRSSQHLLTIQPPQQEYQNVRDSTIKCSRTPSADTNLEISHVRNNSAPINNSQLQYHHSHSNSNSTVSTTDDFVQLRNYHQNLTNNQYSNMSKHTLHALSAVPKPKLTNDWIQHRRSYDVKDYAHDLTSHVHPSWRNSNEYIRTQQQSKRKYDNYSRHWLIQEAEQRRIDQQRSTSRSLIPQPLSSWGATKKSLPDSVIQTITQRVQNLGIGGDKRRQHEGTNRAIVSINGSNSNNNSLSNMNQDVNYMSSQPQLDSPASDKVLSVSGKKKCSHCNVELGRGAAMIIESLRLFYHIDCFKCCVCHVQLGDGLNGTDVRVRNHKLHCHNCYSSDDGVKFSCV